MTNPVKALAIKGIVADGYGRTAIEIVRKLPKWIRDSIDMGHENQFLSEYTSIVRQEEGYWYAKDQMPMPDYTR